MLKDLQLSHQKVSYIEDEKKLIKYASFKCCHQQTKKPLLLLEQTAGRTCNYDKTRFYRKQSLPPRTWKASDLKRSTTLMSRQCCLFRLLQNILIHVNCRNNRNKSKDKNYPQFYNSNTEPPSFSFFFRSKCLLVSSKVFISFIPIKICDDNVWCVNYIPFFINVLSNSKWILWIQASFISNEQTGNQEL